jgi:hypothetical protein
MKKIFPGGLLLLTFCLSFVFPGYAGISSDTIKQIPFTETWDSQSFDTNSWSFPYGQGNWVILADSGNPAPCAGFTGLPSKSNYSYILQSPWFDATGLICDSIIVEFDLKLESVANTNNEVLSLILEYDTISTPVLIKRNFSGFGWKHFKMILTKVHGRLFRLNFNATGQYSVNISGWMIDNFSVTRKCRRPYDLCGGGTMIGSECYVNLFWQPPDCSQLTEVTFAYDEGEPDWWGGSLGTNSWGNFFPVENECVFSGALISFELYFMVSSMSTDDSLYIDVYDESRSLIGSTGAFLHEGGWWITVPAPSIPFTGPFYAMLRPTHGSESNWLGYHQGETGYNLAWYIENGTWKRFSDILYNDSIILFIRATAEINGKKKTIGSADSTVLNGYNVFRSDDYGASFVKLNQTLVESPTFLDIVLHGFHPLYAITAVYENCESDFSDPFFYELPCYVGLGEQFTSTLTIFPNPASSSIKVRSDEPVRTVQITDIMGKILKEIDGEMEREVLIQLDGIPDGLYVVSTMTDHGQVMSKIVISR